MPEGQLLGIVSAKLVLHPQPFFQGSEFVDWTIGTKVVVPMRMLVTPDAFALWRKNVTWELPVPETLNSITSPGAAERGQQYPSICAFASIENNITRAKVALYFVK